MQYLCQFGRLFGKEVIPLQGEIRSFIFPVDIFEHILAAGSDLPG
jgi:hypothetical protein